MTMTIISDQEERWRRSLAMIPLGTAPPFSLACIGASISGLGAFTFDALACMVSADVVYCYPTTSKQYELIKLTNRCVVNLHETEYVRGGEFNAAYDAIVEQVLTAVRGGKKVAYTTQGSPAFHCGTAVRLHRTAQSEGLKSIMIPGVSSFELLITELTLDYELNSIQAYSVLHVMDGTVEIDPQVPCLLFDIGRYALPSIRQPAERFITRNVASVVEKLQRCYPSDHEILLMCVSDDGCSIVRTHFATLLESLTKFRPGVTIFMPPVADEIENAYRKSSG